MSSAVEPAAPGASAPDSDRLEAEILSESPDTADSSDIAEGDETTEIYPSRRRSWIKRILPGSLMGRSLMIIVTPMILLQLVSTWVFYDRHWETMSRRMAEGLAGDIRAVVDLYRRDPADRAALFALARNSMGLQVSLHPGERLAGRTTPGAADTFLGEMLARAIETRLQQPYRLQVGYFERDAFIDVQLAEGVLYIIAPRHRLFSSTTYIFLMWMVGTSMVLFAIATIFMRNQIRPVHRLAQAADMFGRGLDVPNFKPEGGFEVRRAAVAFNKMRLRINRQIRQRTEMLAGVSHDLRTPITRMKLALAFMGDRPEVEELKADLTEMEAMIEAYLAFVRGEGNEKPEWIDLLTLVEDVAGGARRQGANIEVRLMPTEIGARWAGLRQGFSPGLVDTEIQAGDGDSLWMRLRPNALRRCLNNLIVNAQRFGARVAVSLRRTGEHVEILIDDDGPGIPAERRRDVFRPFFRLEASRNPGTGGAGLGLTIARDVARSHGGDIWLEKSPMGGLRVRLRLPL